jgi:hypothetical protein
MMEDESTVKNKNFTLNTHEFNIIVDNFLYYYQNESDPVLAKKIFALTIRNFFSQMIYSIDFNNYDFRFSQYNSKLFLDIAKEVSEAIGYATEIIKINKDRIKFNDKSLDILNKITLSFGILSENDIDYFFNIREERIINKPYKYLGLFTCYKEEKINIEKNIIIQKITDKNKVRIDYSIKKIKSDNRVSECNIKYEYTIDEVMLILFKIYEIGVKFINSDHCVLNSDNVLIDLTWDNVDRCSKVKLI